MLHRLLSPCCTAIMILLLAVPALASDGYAIKLWRPVKAGEKYSLNAAVDEQIKTKIETNGVTKNDAKDTTYKLDALMEVKAADKKGVETTARLTVNALTSAAGNADPVALVAPATQVDVAFTDNHYTYQGVGVQLSPQALQALARTFPRTNEKTIDDEDFGATDKKKLGDTWLVNPKALLRNITIAQASINSEKVAAVAKLAAVQNFYGADWLSIQVTLQASDITGSDALTVREGSVNIEFNGLYPTDPDTQKQTAAAKIQIHMIADLAVTPANPVKRTVTIDAQTNTQQSQILVP